MNKLNSKVLKLVAVLALGVAPLNAAADIIVNEIMPCNISTNRSSDTNYNGWVELYNDGDSKVDIKGYTFKNLKKGGSEKWSYTVGHSCVIEADDFILYYFDGDKEESKYAPFKIDSDGGTFQLLSGTKVVSSLAYPAMVPHISYGVYEDGSIGYMEPSPKLDNTKAYTSLGSRCATPTFSKQPGIAESPVSLSLSCTDGDATIYYTVDGSEPSQKSLKYESPIEIKRQDGQKSVSVRARAYQKGKLSSAIATGSYIFMDDKHEKCNGFTAPIVSLTISDENYKSGTYGIGVVGTNGTTVPGKDCLSQNANYNQDWTRPANFEYIVDGKVVLSQEVEVGVVGGCSRKAEVKSLKVKASKKSGKSSFKYPFFGEGEPAEYPSLHIRNGGNAYSGFMIRDALLQSVARSMGLDCQHYQTVAYYINGSYQGMMGLRTRSNKDLIYAKYGIDEDDLDVVEISEAGKAASCGTLDRYEEMISKVKSLDKSSETYLDEVGKYLDIDYYIDYQIFEQFCVNTDWPGNNNKMWCERQNGRFRSIVYDIDFGFGLFDEGYPNYTGESTDMIQFCLGKNPTNWANRQDFAVELFKNLMDNKDFQERFLTRYLYHLENTFTTDNFEKLWAPIETMAKDEFCASPISHDWEAGWSRMRTFAKNRPERVYGHLKSFFNAGEKIKLNISIQDEKGNVIPNSNIILNNVSTGVSNYSTTYFATHSLRIEPKVPMGYTFKEWKNATGVAATVSTTPILTDKQVWSYYFSDTCPSGEWKTLDYKPTSEWMKGESSFGLHNKVLSPKVTLVDGKDSHYITSYYRTKFTIDDLSGIDSFLCKVTYDDGVVIYVNGKEVKRYNMPSGTVKYGTFTSTYLDDTESSFFLDKSYLVEGENVIAAEVHQYDEKSQDMYFALRLSGVLPGTAKTGEIFEGSLSSDRDLVAIYTKDTKVTAPTLQLNEICSSNNSASGNADEYGYYPDWIEIYNYGTKAIDLAGMYLTDSKSNLSKSIFPYGTKSTIIQPGEYKVVYADNSIWRGPMHADFKISASGGFIGLAYNQQDKVTVIDSITVKPLAANTTYGRELDGTKWTIFGECKGVSTVTFADKNYEGCSGTNEVNDYLSLYDEVDPQALSLYPNPAKDWITVKVTGEFDSDMDNLSGIREVFIYNPHGLAVAHVVANGTPECSVAIDQLTPGIYYLKAISDRSFFTTTFRKE